MRVFVSFGLALAVAVAAGPVLASDYRVLREKEENDLWSYAIKCDNGKERTIVYSKVLKAYYYAMPGMGEPRATLDAAARYVCEKT